MSKIMYRDAISQAIAEEMRRDPNVIMLGEDIGEFGGAMGASRGLYEEFGPDRIIDTPISENAIIGAALGAAITGLRSIAEIMFVDFTTCCMDQIVNQVAKVRYMLGGQVEVPLVIRTQCGGGKSYAAQHSQCLESWFAHVPGLKVVMPASAADAKGLLKSSIRSNDPVIFIEHKLLYSVKGDVPDDTDFVVPIGKGEVVRQGADVTIVSYSYQLLVVQKVAESLSEEGISCEIIDLKTISPLDMPIILKSLKKTGRLMIVEEGVRSFGVGSEISARVMEEGFDLLETPVIRIGAMDVPIPFSPVLEKEVLPNEDKIAQQVRSLFSPTE